MLETFNKDASAQFRRCNLAQILLRRLLFWIEYRTGLIFGLLSPGQTYRHCLTNISNFDCRVCLCVSPPRQTLLDKHVCLSISKICFACLNACFGRGFRFPRKLLVILKPGQTNKHCLVTIDVLLVKHNVGRFGHHTNMCLTNIFCL